MTLFWWYIYWVYQGSVNQNIFLTWVQCCFYYGSVFLTRLPENVLYFEVKIWIFSRHNLYCRFGGLAPLLLSWYPVFKQGTHGSEKSRKSGNFVRNASLQGKIGDFFFKKIIREKSGIFFQGAGLWFKANYCDSYPVDPGCTGVGIFMDFCHQTLSQSDDSDQLI